MPGCGLVAFKSDVGLLNAGLLFLLLALLIAAYWGRDVGLLAAILTNLALNFFFIGPLYTFTVQAPRNIVALAVFLAVSVVGSSLLAEEEERSSGHICWIAATHRHDWRQVRLVS